jgi:hypothetical protein
MKFKKAVLMLAVSTLVILVVLLIFAQTPLSYPPGRLDQLADRALSRSVAGPDSCGRHVSRPDPRRRKMV